MMQRHHSEFDSVCVTSVEVNVFEARNIVSGSCDPYAVVEVEEVHSKTQTLRDTTFPRWNETFSFGVVDLPSAKGLIKVYARRLARKDTLVARFVLNLSVISGATHATDLVLMEALTPEERKKKEKDSSWTPAECTVRLRVLEDPLRGIVAGVMPTAPETAEPSPAPALSKEQSSGVVAAVSASYDVNIEPQHSNTDDHEHISPHHHDFHPNPRDYDADCGAPPPAEVADDTTILRARLTDFYTAHGIEKTEQEVSSIVELWALKPHDALFATLEKKYGTPTDVDEGFKTGFVANAEHREKLIAFYTIHAPEKVPNVDMILEAFQGREAELFSNLEKRYFEEQESDLNNPYRPRLLRFYTVYAPEKCSLVTRALRTYEGQEETLFQSLVQRYGPEPTSVDEVMEAGQQHAEVGLTTTEGSCSTTEADSTNPYGPRLERFFTEYAPEKLTTITKALKMYAGHEEELMTALVAKYGPEPLTTISTLPSAAIAPSPPPSEESNSLDAAADPQATSTLTASSSSSSRTPPLQSLPTVSETGVATELQPALSAGNTLESVESGADVPPPLPLPQDDVADSPTHTPPQEQNYQPPDVAAPTARQRLVQFYQHYAPEKLDKVDEAMQTYQGREEELMAALVAHYGPEPELNSFPHARDDDDDAQPGISTATTTVTSLPQGADCTVDVKLRLDRWLAVASPDMLPKTAETLEQFRGREDELFARIEERYGREPPVERGDAALVAMQQQAATPAGVVPTATSTHTPNPMPTTTQVHTPQYPQQGGSGLAYDPSAQPFLPQHFHHHPGVNGPPPLPPQQMPTPPFPPGDGGFYAL